MRNLRTAVHDIHLAREAAEVAGRNRRQARAGITAVDALLAVIEDGHLAGASRGGGMRAEWLALLEDAGLDVPHGITGARTTVELHARLLEWQEELLAESDPRRSELLATLDGPDLDSPLDDVDSGRHASSAPPRPASAAPRPGSLWACTPAFRYERNRSR